MPHATTIEKLVICEPGKSRSTVHVFAAHPTPAEERMLGKVVLLAELETSDPVNTDIIHELQKELQKSYYASEELNPEVAFEHALTQINQKVGDLVADYASSWHESLNIIAMVVHGEHLFLAESGRVHVFLIHGDRITDILGAAPQTHQTPSPLKVFTNVITGRIQPDEYLLLTTPALLDYFSQEKLRRMITEHPPREAMDRIESILADNVNRSAFGAVLLHAEKEQVHQETFASSASILPRYAPTRAEHSAPQASMDRLIERQATTQEFLSPSLLANTKKWLAAKTSQASDLVRRKVFRESPRRIRMQNEFRDYGHAWSPSQARRTHTVLQIITKSIAALSRAVFRVFALVVSMVQRRETPKPLATAPRKLLTFPSRVIIWVKSLPIRAKVLLALALVLVFIFTQSIVSQGVEKLNSTTSADYQASVDEIERLLVEADASLSYGNYGSARETAERIEALLAQLPTRSDEQETLANDLTKRLHSVRERSSLLTRIDQPTLIADLSSASQGKDVAGLTIIGKELFAFTASDNLILRTRIEDGATELFAQAAAAPSFQHMARSTSGSLLFLNASNGLNEFTINAKALRDISFPFSSQSANVIDTDHYESRLYLLDIADNQILRATRSGNAYSAPADWLRENITLQDARSLAVDGSIYILFANGQVSKFTRGAGESFALEEIEPALSSGTKIWTDQDSDRLYILDSSSKRLLVFTKEGTLVNQYTSDSFGSLRDFTIDDAEQNAYILDETKIIVVPLT